MNSLFLLQLIEHEDGHVDMPVTFDVSFWNLCDCFVTFEVIVRFNISMVASFWFMLLCCNHASFCFLVVSYYSSHLFELLDGHEI